MTTARAKSAGVRAEVFIEAARRVAEELNISACGAIMAGCEFNGVPTKHAREARSFLARMFKPWQKTRHEFWWDGEDQINCRVLALLLCACLATDREGGSNLT